MDADKRLFLLDGHALVYRAHYAFINRPLINSKGMNTSAITGFVRTLWDLIQTQKPSHIAVSFDLKGPTFRHEMYAEYKANREAEPEDITQAFPYIMELVKAFRIPIMSCEGFEADDVIGTLAKQAEKAGYTVYMVTPDKDFAQLVSDKVFIYKPSRMGNDIEILGEKEVLEKWQIKRVEQVIDVLGLQGDSVDNIPGIPGIGPKTAVKLLEQYDSVENLIAHADELQGKQREKVIEFAEQGLMSKRLATIDTQVPIQFDEKDFNLDPFDKERLAELFKELEFRTLAQSILQEPGETPARPAMAGTQGDLFASDSAATPQPPKAPATHSVAEQNIHSVPHQYHLVDTDEKREALIRLLAAEPAFCLDTETTDVDANQAELVGMSFAVKPHEAWYVPVPEDQKAARALVASFRSVLENDHIQKIGQNLKYDSLVLKWYGIELKGPFFDTMVAHYLLEPELRHNMNYLAETYLKYQPVTIEEVIGKKGKGQVTMREASLDQVVEYAAEDADITLQLKEYLAPKLKEENLLGLYEKMEAPLIKAITEMEYNGVNVDVDFLNVYSKELEVEIEALDKRIQEEVGLKFNVASPKQVGEVLFEHLKLPYRWRKTKSGQYSTNEEKLAEMAHEFPIVDQILRHRGLAKLKSTYVDALPRMTNPRTGRVHSSFNQALAATGRLSSNNPNLQNIPVRTPEGARVREAFIPRGEEYLLLASDYSQIELRLIAEISGDEAMLEAFQEGKDIHRATAARVFEVPFEEVTKEQRYRAKTVNFSIIYGAGAMNLSRQLDIRRTEAKDLIDNYFKQYSGLKRYMDEVVEEARRKGYVRTLMGRRRYLRDINSRNAVIRGHSERNAINTPIQGTAADLIKMAMVRIHELLQKGNYRTKMILQVHDELVFDVHQAELEELRPRIEEEMRRAIPDLKVPIVVESGVGKNWLEAH